MTRRPQTIRDPGPHYETFVIRFCTELSGISHGEIRHVPTGSEARFRRVTEALEFMKLFVPLESVNRHSDTGPLR